MVENLYYNFIDNFVISLYLDLKIKAKVSINHCKHSLRCWKRVPKHASYFIYFFKFPNLFELQFQAQYSKLNIVN